MHTDYYLITIVCICIALVMKTMNRVFEDAGLDIGIVIFTVSYHLMPVDPTILRG